MKKTIIVILFLLVGTFTAKAQNIDSAYILRDSAFSAFRQGDYQIALQIAEHMFPMIPSDSLSLLNDYYSIIGNCNFYFSNHEECIAACEKRIAILEQTQNKDGLASVYNTLAVSFLELDKLDQALAFSDKAIDLMRELDYENTTRLAGYLGKKSEILAHINRYDEAIEVLNEALAMDRSSGDNDRIAMRLAQIGNIYTYQRRFQESRPYYEESLSLIDTALHNYTYNSIIYQLGFVEWDAKNYALAEKYFLKQLEHSKRMQYTDNVNNTYWTLSNLYENTDPKKALFYFKEHQKIEDSIHSVELKSRMDEFQVKYETIEKEKVIEQQRLENERKEWLIRMWSIFAILMAVVLVVIIILFYRISRKNKELSHLNETKTRLFSIISHDLKTPIAAQNKVMDVVCQNYKSMSPEQIEQILNSLKTSSEALEGQLANMVQWGKSEMGKLDFVPISFKLYDKIYDCIKPLMGQMNDKSLILDVAIPTDYIVNFDINVFDVTLRNLLGNAIKFSHKGGTISVFTTENKGKTYLAVKDEGVGMSEARRLQLFQLAVKSSAGTTGEKGSGIGLFVTKQLLDKAGSDILVESEEGKGTTIMFSI